MRRPSLSMVRRADPAGERQVRHDALVQELAIATTAREAADAECRRLLIDGEADARTLTGAEEAAYRAESRERRLRDATQALAAEIERARLDVLAEQDRSARSAAVAEIGVRTARIVEVIGRVETAALNLNRELEEAEAVVMANGFAGGYLDPITSTTFSVDQAALRQASPITRRRHPNTSFAATVTDAIAPMLARMNALAVDITEGRAPASLPTAQELVMAKAIVVDETLAVLPEGIAYRHTDTSIRQVPRGGMTIPVPLAEYLFARKLAFPVDSRNGQTILSRLASSPLGLTVNDADEVVNTTEAQPVFREVDFDLTVWIDEQRALAA